MRSLRKTITALSPAIILVSVLCGNISGQSGLTTIQDTLFDADGTRYNGTLFIQWSTFDTINPGTIIHQSRTVQVVNGNLLVQLAPNISATPPANLYTVLYQSDGDQQYSETWTVPVSTTPLKVAQVRTGSGTGGSGSVGGLTGGTGGTEASITNLVSDLNARPVKGPGYGTSAVAVIDQNGLIETAVGNLGDCVFVDGSTGPCSTPVALPTWVNAETPAGLINGINTTYTLANAPSGSSLLLFRNGLLQASGMDYTLSGSTIQIVSGFIPQAPDTLVAEYRLDSGTSGGGSGGGGSGSSGAAGVNGCGAVGAVSKSSSYQIQASDDGYLLVQTGAANFTLPSAIPAAGWCVVLLDTNAAGITVQNNGAAINGVSAGYALQPANTIFVVSDGAEYWLSGANGVAGAAGATGTAGSAGATGATGPAGATGTAGSAGAAGATGVAGAAGATGATGPAGVAGVAGATGATGATGSAGGSRPAYTVVTYGATPVFPITANTTIQNLEIDLTGNVSSSTLTTGGATIGQDIGFKICQDVTGSRTFSWPTNVVNPGSISGSASTCSKQLFRWDGTNAVAFSGMVTDGTTPGVTTSTGFLTFMAGTDTFAGLTSSQTLSNKTLVAPALGTPVSGTGTNLTGIPPGATTARQGNGSKFQLSTGSTTTGDCVEFDANGNTVDTGSACGSGGGLPSGTGVVKVTAGAGGLVSGTSTNCVLVNGNSAACGSSAGPGGNAASIGGSFTIAVNGNLTFTTVNKDTGGYANLTAHNDRLTIPGGQTGWYSVCIQAASTNNSYSGNTNIQPLVNGSGDPFISPYFVIAANWYQPSFGGCYLTYRTAGDYVSFSLYQGTGVPQTFNLSFSLAWVGQ